MPVFHSEAFFSVSPNGTGFLGAWVQFGSLPNAEIVGHHPDIDSSSTTTMLLTFFFFHYFYLKKEGTNPMVLFVYEHATTFCNQSNKGQPTQIL